MENIGWKQFQKLTEEEIAAGPCLKVNYNGILSFIVVVRPEQGMLDRVAGLCTHVDAGKGNPKLPERVFPPQKKIVTEPLMPFDSEGNEIDTDLWLENQEALETLTAADIPQG